MLFKKKTKASDPENVQIIDPENYSDFEVDTGTETTFAEKLVRWIMLAAVMAMALFHLGTACFGLRPALTQRGIHLALALMVSFMLFIDLKKSKWTMLWMIPAVLGLISAGYFGLFNQQLSLHYFSPRWYELAAGAMMILLTFVACKKQHGWVMPIIMFVFLIYPYFGQYLPGILKTPSTSITEIIIKQTFHAEGVFSTPLSTSANYIILFTIFGAFLEYTGTGQFIIDISRACLGTFRGGPAKIAVVSSALFGTVSGSAAANVVGTGTLTIPMMKNTGYRAQFAAAVEAAASTGGQIMPPVMGAASFIMAEFLGIPYSAVIKAAVIPALLYFIGILFTVDLEACKNNLRGLPRSELPSPWKVLKEGWYLAIPIILLLTLMMVGVTLHRSGFISIVVMTVISLITKRMKISEIPTALFKGVKSGVGIATLSAGAGIIVGSLAMSGLGPKLSSILISVAGGKLVLLLLLTMLTSLIFGMGMPTSAAYIILAVVVAPALTAMNVEPIAAHMFCFYFGIMSVITPPVAIAAYNGAAIAKCNPNAAGWEAVRLAAGGFIIPFIFVNNPSLLMIGILPEILLNLCTALLGMYMLSVGLIGFFKIKLSWLLRIVMLVAALTLIIPGILTDIIGLVLGGTVMAICIMRHRKDTTMSSAA